MAGPPGWRNRSGSLPLRLCGGCFRAAGACAGLRWPGSLWQRRRCGPSLRARVGARQSQQPPAPRPLGHERGLPPRPATLAASAAASQLWAGAGNMSLAAYCYLRVVGRGSYGEVTLVRHRRDGRQVGGVGARQGVEGRQPFAKAAVQRLGSGWSEGNSTSDVTSSGKPFHTTKSRPGLTVICAPNSCSSS